MNWLDRSIAFFAPRYAYRRANARRWYEAASNAERLRDWKPVGDAKSSYLSKTIRERARDLYRNNPYAHRAVNTFASYAVGKGITPHAFVQRGLKSKAHEEFLKQWADTSLCDANNRHTLYGLQSIATQHLVRDGEVFLQRVMADDLLPLKLRMLDPDFLDTNRTERGQNRDVIQGVEYDNQGIVTAYYFFERNPNEQSYSVPKSKRIPASDIIHLFRTDFAGQTRGISWLAPIMVRMRDLDEYEDAHIVRQKIAAMFVGVIRDLEPLDIEETEKALRKMEPGSWFPAPPGKTVEFSNPPSVEGFGEYIEHSKYTIATGLGIPYMILSSDFSKANYSNARMAMLNFYKLIEQVQNHILIPQFCDRVFQWFLEACELRGLRGDGVRCLWVPPKKDIVDPLKDYQAYKIGVEENFISHASVVRELGDDPDSTYQEIANVKKQLKKLGIENETNNEKS
ncbi:MAG: phage portal protein [Deltaproteobacteria bacterium]|nr:phage portal protein [Deltaproteobacteria bacterium]